MRSIGMRARSVTSVSTVKEVLVPRLISFIVLLAIVLLVGAVFFQVMAQFIVPLFLACVLLVMFQPRYQWLLRRMPGHPRIAALITTALILLAVLLPLAWLGWNAYGELHDLILKNAAGDSASPAAPASVDPSANAITESTPDEAAVGNAKSGSFNENVLNIAFKLREDLKRITNISIDDNDVRTIVRDGQRFVATKAIAGAQTAIGILVGLAIMVIALYYFFADGPGMIETILDLSPLDSHYEQELLARFGDVSRAVVVATLLSAVVQGLLAGVGYAIALPAGAPVFLLTAVTMTTALVPFVGAAATWICVCGWIYLYGEHTAGGQVLHGDPKTAIILAVYCTLVVSGIDNVIKPFILHGQSKLHPLLALLSILGGVQVLGPVGILVGPMLVSFLQALLEMLRKELDSFSTPVVEGVPLAVAAAGAAPPVSTANTVVSATAGGETNAAGAAAAGGKVTGAVRRALGRRSKRKK